MSSAPIIAVPASLTRLRWVPLVVLGAVLAIAGATLLFTTFMIYDDEGYVLFSLKSFTEGGGLYDRVYSQYGPFFFLFNQVLHFAGFAFTNTGARLLVFCYWLGAAGFCGALVWRVTRSVTATFLATAGVFMHLLPVTAEPSHPGGLIVFLVAAAAWAGVKWSTQPRILAVVIGAVGAALCLIKINVGAFLLVSASAWWILHLPREKLGGKVRGWLVAAAMGLLPLALMRSQLGLTWVATFAIVSGAAGAAMILAVSRGSTPTTSGNDLVRAIVAAVTVTGLTAAGILAQGTSLHNLIEGVILGPLRHPQVYTAQVNWRFGATGYALLSLAVACVMTLRPAVIRAHWIAVGRLAAIAWYFLAWIFPGIVNPHAFALSYSLTLTWLFVLPLGDDAETQPARAWLGLLLIPQALHAFPVAGSQISWGTFLWVPLAVIAGRDAMHTLSAVWKPARLAPPALAVMLALGMFVRCALTAELGLTRVRESDPLRLPGAEALWLPENLTTTLRVLARNATAHADVLFSLPGMLSFHLWTDVPPPTPANATHWFTLLSPAQQEAIRGRLAGSPLSCVIVQRDVYEFLVRNKIATESPLKLWLDANYTPAFKLETYEFWVRKGRSIAALNTAELGEASAGVSPHYQLSLVLAETQLPDISGVELARFDGDLAKTVTTWTKTDAQVFITPLTSAGADAGPTRPVSFPFQASGLVRIAVRTDRFPEGFQPGHSVLYLSDGAGQRVAEARFVQ